MIIDYPKSVVGDDPKVIETFVTRYFAELDGAGIVWAISHGWYGLPSYARHDIDVMVGRKDVSRSVELMFKVAEETGWHVYGKFRSSILWSYWLLKDDAEKGQSYFQVDIMIDSGLRGVSFFQQTPKQALAERWRNEAGVWCVRKSYAAASVLLKEVIANGKFEGELRMRHIEEAIAEDPEELRTRIRETFEDDGLADRLLDVCRRKAWDELPGMASEVRRKYVKFRFRDTAIMIRYVYDYFRLRFFPFLRLFVVVIGPDGCGKSSVCDGIVARFHRRPFFQYRRMHANFWGVVRLRDIKKSILSVFGKKVEFAPDAAPGTAMAGMTPPLGCFRSMAYIAYYGMWMCFGFVKLFMWRCLASVLIADRYYHDYYYMRNHRNSPRWFKNLVYLIIPKPQLVLFLDRPAEDIFAQKPELTVEEIKSEQHVIREVFGHKRGFRVIDASHGLDSTIKAVNREIELWLAERNV